MPGAHHLGSHDVLLGYHAMLLTDPHRMTAYERAVRSRVRPGMVVLDLGAGTGLWGLLAARLGARVHLVESGPVARLARRLAEHNGLADRVTVHEADMLDLPVAEPVDLVISEFMGRFVVDDGMLAAVDRARDWLKPGGVFVPGRLSLKLAPAEVRIPQIEAFRGGVFGLDLAPALPALHHTCYAAQLPEAALLGPGAEVVVLEPPEVTGPIDASLTWAVTRNGTLTALAGWFDADLAEGVVLSTRPGVQTHWQQYLFPIPAVAVRAGDRVSATLTLEDPAGSARWRWTGEVRRDGAVFHAFAQHSEQRQELARAPVGVVARGTEAVRAAVADAEAAAARDDLHGAAESWARAVLATEPTAVHTPSLYENLGLARMQTGDLDGAIRAFLRALDGQPTSRPNALRWLVVTLVNAGRHEDAARYLAVWEQAFGEHPDARRS